MTDFVGDYKVDITPPADSTKIYKDECTYCYKTAFYPGGLFVCLKSYTCFCQQHLKKYAEDTGCRAFVHVESVKTTKETATTDSIMDTGEPIPKITKLAIGTEGGFDSDKMELIDYCHLVIYPQVDKMFDLSNIDDNPGFPEDLYHAAIKVKNCTSAERLQMLQNANNAWNGDIKLITKHTDIPQMQNGKIIPTSGWKCEHPDCDMTENLWLNLSDGAIRCGRSQYLVGGTMSKGNNHMKSYYENTGFPLVVKLGTISSEETADVYSYDEDDSVINPNLRKQLAFWGLDMDSLKKTERSTLEMELDLNQKWEWAKCVEDGAELENKYGPGYTGLVNIGSSCYMNSVLQALLLIPSFHKRFVENADKEFDRVSLQEVHADVNSQFAKLFSSLMSGEHAKKELEEKNLNGIKPTLFKTVIAGSHPEFRTAQQQDAEEFLRFLAERITNKTPAEEEDPTMPLRFKIESRFEDVASSQVRYTEKDELVLGIPVREELMFPLPPKEGETETRYQATLERLIESAFSPSFIEGFKSPITGEEKGASTTQRFKTFPEFLIIQIQKFALSADYRVKKFDMDVIVDDILDLNALRGTGKKAEETLLPDSVQEPINFAIPEYDKEIASQLHQMGFSENASIRAAIEVRDTNGTAEQAMEWLFTRLEDPSINEPVQPVAQKVDKKAAAERPCVQELMSIGGFSSHQAIYALNKFQDVNQAAEWLFDHSSEIPDEEPSAPEAATIPTNTTSSSPPVDVTDGNGKYKLVGFISHMGSSPHSGHYVAHLYKDGQWILFNDEKVAVSQSPPRQLGYLYIYRRM